MVCDLTKANCMTSRANDDGILTPKIPLGARKVSSKAVKDKNGIGLGAAIERFRDHILDFHGLSRRTRFNMFSQLLQNGKVIGSILSAFSLFSGREDQSSDFGLFFFTQVQIFSPVFIPEVTGSPACSVAL